MKLDRDGHDLILPQITCRPFTSSIGFTCRRSYRRRLPHWDPPGKALFLTWRLHGSLPAGRAFPRGEEFEAFDRLLDGMSSGPLYLRMPEIAEIVAEEVLRVEGIRVSAWVNLPSHVHLLAEAVSEADADWARHLKMIKGRIGPASEFGSGEDGTAVLAGGVSVPYSACWFPGLF
ncbi:MAG: hypothetical protein K2X03_02685 [Bryobacteraceae bacterium]|nr:hypothetical protein [Bryobacteraceae bacterium]